LDGSTDGMNKTMKQMMAMMATDELDLSDKKIKK
jgi:hypothetical protein